MTQNAPPTPISAEDEFVAEMCRTYLVQWADRQVRDPASLAIPEDAPPRYVEFARQRKWVSADGKKVLAQGFKVAASYLRR